MNDTNDLKNFVSQTLQLQPHIKFADWQALMSLSKKNDELEELQAQLVAKQAAAYKTGYEQGKQAGFEAGLHKWDALTGAEQRMLDNMKPKMEALVLSAIRNLLNDDVKKPSIASRLDWAFKEAQYPLNATIQVHPSRLVQAQEWLEKLQQASETAEQVKTVLNTALIVANADLGVLDIKIDCNSAVFEASIEHQLRTLQPWLGNQIDQLVENENS